MKLTFLPAAVFLFPYLASAFSPSEVIPAEQVKRNVYVSDSVISGGDAQANAVILSGVRWAKNPAGYERLVVDLAGEGSGWESKAPPYFQVGHDSHANAINLSIHGVSQRAVSGSNVTKAVSRSSLIAQAYMAPSYEGDLAALEFKTRAPVDVESFYLVNPPRIVIDVRAKR
ncbi:MAG TPA: hypothetical protein VIH99_06455 [Bdellovibrionota bacterium]|jgi:hypothetical protein